MSGECLQATFDNEALEPIQPTLKPGKKQHILVHHDRSIYCSKILQQRVWVKNGKIPQRKKGQGREIHVSDFIIEMMGHLSLLQQV